MSPLLFWQMMSCVFALFAWRAMKNAKGAQEKASSIAEILTERDQRDKRLGSRRVTMPAETPERAQERREGAICKAGWCMYSDEGEHEGHLFGDSGA